MLDVADRRVDGFSKGMRQRTKVAAALVTDPSVLVLDEPLNGADPVQRAHLIDLFRRLGAEGRTVIVSSHVLHEVERLADRIIVLIHGRLAAAGDQRAIRDAMNDRPRHVLVRASRRPEAGGRARSVSTSVAGVRLDGDDVVISTSRAAELALALPAVASDLSRAAARGATARRLAREPVPGAGPMSARPLPPRRRPRLVRDRRLHAALVHRAEAVARLSAALRGRAAVRARSRSPSTSRRARRSPASRPTASSPSSCRSPRSSSATPCSAPRCAPACSISRG